MKHFTFSTYKYQGQIKCKHCPFFDRYTEREINPIHVPRCSLGHVVNWLDASCTEAGPIDNKCDLVHVHWIRSI
jgi:hypothetical protein